ncbi:MAG TPA: L-lactate permease [Geobacteraceae bacterium]|nr:L-lactate permease [Geobacteraceae bacterium]
MLKLNFFLSWTPILLIFVLAIFYHASALKLSVWGVLCTILLTATVFKTDPGVMALAAMDGILTTAPLLLVVYFGILLSLFLIQKGSLQRLAGWLDAAGRLSPVNHALLLSFGVGNFLEGAGIIAEPVAAPMIYASGIRPNASVALSVIGYSGLMHLSLAGVIVTVLAAVTAIPAPTLAWDLGILSFVPVMLFAFSVPWIVRVPNGLRKSFPSLIVTGLLAASTALLAARFIAVSIAGMLAGIIVVAFFYVITRHLPRMQPSLLQDLAPFLLILASLASVNLFPPLRHLCRDEWIVTFSLVPGHGITLRPLFDAYLYLFLAFLLAYRLHAAREESIATLICTGSRKASGAVAAVALFGAMGQIIAYSGYQEGFGHLIPDNNIPLCLADGLITCTGRFYPMFAPFLGWIGTFLTGYGMASIMLFAKLQVQTAQLMGISASLLASSLAVGASIGSVSSPFKIALAAPLCGAEGREGEILRKTIPLGLAVSFATGVFTLFIAWMQ